MFIRSRSIKRSKTETKHSTEKFHAVQIGGTHYRPHGRKQTLTGRAKSFPSRKKQNRLSTYAEIKAEISGGGKSKVKRMQRSRHDRK